MVNLSELLSPNTIAIIGASNNPQKIGGIVVKNIIDSGYKGKIYPVNLKEATVQNLTAYPNISSLPEIPDLAIFAIPSEILLPVLEEAGEKKIKNILIYTAGFKEAGEEGKLLESKLLSISEKYGFSLLGPNCLGFVNNSHDLNATFGKVSRQNGNLRILSQSGAIATSFFDWAEKNQIGLNQFITLGNKSVLNENQFLDFWQQNPIDDQYKNSGLSNNEPIGLYLESITEGKEFLEICKKITVKNPIFIIKPGKSEGAATAMMSHTGSLAGSDSVLETALKESGVIRCDTLEEFFSVGKCLSWENAPKGRNVAIISNAGGPAVISADAVETYGLKLSKLSEVSTNRLKELLPRMAGLHNPVDVLGDALADRYKIALDEVLKEEDVDSALVILTPQIMTQIEDTAKIIGELSAKYQKPIVCSFIGGGQIEIGEKALNNFCIPNFAFPEQAIKTISKIVEWSEYKLKETSESHKSSFIPRFSISAASKFVKSINKEPGLVNPQNTSYLLEIAQISEPVSIVTNDLKTAQNFALEAGFPVVLKVATKNLVHKSDSGGVVTNLNSSEEIAKAWQTMNSGNVDILVQKQIEGGQELILGFKRDDIFGNTFFFGAGGKYVNLLNDKNLSLFPLTDEKLKTQITNSKIFPLLNGYRGTAKLDINKIISLSQKLGFLFENIEEIKEMEINPVIINEQGIYCADTKIILK